MGVGYVGVRGIVVVVVLSEAKEERERGTRNKKGKEGGVELSQSRADLQARLTDGISGGVSHFQTGSRGSSHPSHEQARQG